jgi:hypothetical protein
MAILNKSICIKIRLDSKPDLVIVPTLFVCPSWNRSGRPFRIIRIHEERNEVSCNWVGTMWLPNC